jgi:hypothetical protein
VRSYISHNAPAKNPLRQSLAEAVVQLPVDEVVVG